MERPELELSALLNPEPDVDLCERVLACTPTKKLHAGIGESRVQIAATGDKVSIAGVTGNTAAKRTLFVTKLDDNRLSLTNRPATESAPAAEPGIL